MKQKSVSIVFIIILLLSMLSGCGAQAYSVQTGETFLFTDSSGRQVQIPSEITRIAPSGAVATMILATIAPEYMVSVSNSPSSSQYQYLPQNLMKLPTTGQLYGSKSTINLEALLNANPQVIIDLGDAKEGIDKDMDQLQKQTGIPTIFIQGDLAHMAEAYRQLGKLLSGKTRRGEDIATFMDHTIAMAMLNKEKIRNQEPISVMYATGTSGLNTNAEGSVQSQVLDLIGVKNAIVVSDISNKGGGNTISMEQLYLFDPDIILFTTGSVYEKVGNEPVWSRLHAVQQDRYYEIPGLPYNWMSNPPSMNMILGIYWMGNLIYPDLYSYDMEDKTKEIYKLFWNYDMSSEEAESLLYNSTEKRMRQGEIQ